MKPVLMTAVLATVAAVSLHAQEVDLGPFRPSLKRLDNLPRSAEDNAKVDLGRHLFYEKRLSKDNSISCNSCHELNKYGVDGEAFSQGFGGVRVGRNSPTAYNAFMHIAQFWDGRAATVEEQAKGPVLAAKEMAMPSSDEVVRRLKAIPEYQALFKAAFPRTADPITYDNVGEAIGTFERYLTTPARFDAYLDGKKDGITAAEKEGLATFIKVGCVSCHSGTLIGGHDYRKLGAVKPWPNQKDQGRYDVTKQNDDKMVFKIQSLRNIAKTGPYFHDSSATKLEDAVRLMARHQLGLELPAADIKKIVTFLNALTGELPLDYIAQQPLKAPAKGKASFE